MTLNLSNPKIALALHRTLARPGQLQGGRWIVGHTTDEASALIVLDIQEFGTTTIVAAYGKNEVIALDVGDCATVRGMVRAALDAIGMADVAVDMSVLGDRPRSVGAVLRDLGVNRRRRSFRASGDVHGVVPAPQHREHLTEAARLEGLGAERDERDARMDRLAWR